MNDIPPDWDLELQSLRDAATQAGIRASVEPRDLGIELESAADLLARLKAGDAPRDELAGRRARRRRMSLIASSAAAVAVLLVGVLQPWNPTPVQASTPALLDYQYANADVIASAPGKDPTLPLRKLAAAASKMPNVTVGSDTHHVVTDGWFAELDTVSDDDNAPLIPQVTEAWLAPDGSLRIVERRGDPLPSDGRGLPADGAWTDQPATADTTQPAGSVEPDLVASLPRDPDELRTALVKIAGCDERPSTDRSLCLFQLISNLHQTYVVPSDVDAALWQLLSDEVGLRSLGEVKDRAGRRGIGISLIAASRPEFRRVLIADPKTGALIGTEEILISPVAGIALEAPAIVSFTAILESKYVD